MAEIDLKNFQGFDPEAILSLSGYKAHRIEPEGDGKGGEIHKWLVVDGVSQGDLDAVMQVYNHSAYMDKIAKEQASEDLKETDSSMFDVIETIIANTPGLRAKLPQDQQNLLTQRETLRAQM